MKGKATFKMAGLRAKHWRAASHLKGAGATGAPTVLETKQKGKSAAKPWSSAGKLWGHTESL